MRRLLMLLLTLTLAAALTAPAWARICPKCGRNHLPDLLKEQPKPQQPPKEDAAGEDKSKDDEAAQQEEPAATLSVARARFFAPSVEVADEADRILDRLEERYGKPRTWRPFPIYYKRYKGDGVAGYTLYSQPEVKEVVIFETFSDSVGATLDHELTHAFFFYFLNSNFDLFLNEGLAQNSEYRRRESLRQTVYRRYTAGQFWELDQLYGRNKYDGSLLIYHQGFSVVDFLIGRGGSLYFAAFMQQLVRTNDFDGCLRSFYGYKNIKELQAAWQVYIETGQNRATLPAVR